MSDSVYQPKPDIAARAHIGSMESYQALYDKSIQSPSQFWNKHAGRITFFHPYGTVVEEDFEKPGVAWFQGGRLNA
ncbi:MAG: acetyl-coenzyme A synthetase N-terminal domain-containing protein, partial [Planctomycetota bacterium]